MDEEAVIGEFLDWCHQGIDEAGIAAEIIIIDSSSDRTGDIALAKDARVLGSPQRGLGRAYIDAIPFIRGRYVLMGTPTAPMIFAN
jgi:glycosyltransferase involved in cell wall biosynthesis